jgi:prophage regulatory protein
MANEIIRLPEVKRRTGLSRAKIYALIAQGSFPKQIKLTERAAGWLVDEVDGWIEQRIAQSRQTEAA